MPTMGPCLMPERLNLAIARRCHVSCSGCYTYFGQKEPDLSAFLASVAVFIRIGISKITVSGGDPMTIADLPEFLHNLRVAGVELIKVDTVGVGLLPSETQSGSHAWGLADVVGGTDFLGIPVDGWSNESVLQFRHGRHNLYTETVALLNALDRLGGPPKVIINTVAHRGNLAFLARIHAEVRQHSAVCHWNIFQYTPTDQAAGEANKRFSVSDEAFGHTALVSSFAAVTGDSAGPRIEFHSTASRLGQYLLINSDGEAWLPDADGHTIRLGLVFGAEESVLERWAGAVATLRETSCPRASRIVPGFAGVT